MDEQLEAIQARLRQCGQEHLVGFWEELDDSQKDNLLKQIEKIDLARVPGWVVDYVKNGKPLQVPTEFGPAPSYPAVAKTAEQEEQYKTAIEIGEKMLAEGKVAGFVVAGGQGTRLGFDGPKGCYPTSPIKKKTLFQLFAENILAANKKYGVSLPWYIMTSPLNHEPTKQALASNDYFGLNKDDVILFQQGTLPNFDFDGKIFLADRDEIAKSPDGHGGSLKALADSGALADMQKRGIECISYWQVDNPLIKIFDPLFIGLHVMDGAGMSSKALKKAAPLEKVGNFCQVDGKVTVIEYSDLPDEKALMTNEDGSLVFEMGSIGIHMISTSFVEKLNKGDGFGLPIHRAVKKIPHIKADGTFVTPEEPCGVKLETFVFDALPMAAASIILETERSEEFAPVKNATGVDSAEVTCRMMIDRAATWLEQAGVNVPRKADGCPDCVIEMSSLFALSPADVKAKVDQVPAIRPGDSVYLG